MNRYTIYCTAEQTKKALLLGASLQYASINDIRLGRYIEGICDNEAYCIPTAEQMIGWLEEQGLQISLLYGFEFDGKWDYCSDYKGKQMPCTSMGEFETRKSATLDAINEALNYLVNLKQ